MKKRFAKVLSLFLVFVIPLLSCAVIGAGQKAAAAAENVYFSEDFENGISGWVPAPKNKVPFTLAQSKAETNAMSFSYAYNPSDSDNRDASPYISSPNYNAVVKGATHMAFDFYLDADAANAASGSMRISSVIQSPEHGYWFALPSKDIVFSEGEPCGDVIKYSVSLELKDSTENILLSTDTARNFMFVTSGVATDYNGKMYYDNIRLVDYGTKELIISDVTVKNPYTLKPETTAEITCTAEGGVAPYSYAFYILKNGKVFYKSDGWNSRNTLNYVPQEAGDFTLVSYCRDASGKEISFRKALKIYDESEVVVADKLIALTFDDGPDSNAGELLDILKEKDVKATFYVLHSYAKNNTELLKRTAQEGHQIGNHTYTHPYLTQLSESEAKEEIENNADFIQSATGVYPKTYRPPYMDYNETLLNYFPDQTAIGCSIDSRDWNGISAEEIITNVVANAKDGDIVLMHEPQANTRAAIGEIIDRLRADGFEFVTVDELFRRQNVPMKGASYYNRVDYHASETPDALTAKELVSEFQIGWNLGNTMDSHGAWLGTMGDPYKYETAWKNPVTTKAMIDEVKSAGFQAIRVPTTWYQHLDDYDNIDPAWMARVKEVVDYGIDNDIYVILNIHHENSWLKLDGSIPYNTMEARLRKIWTQISEEFADYDQHLIFEVLNEPRTVGAADEWSGNQDACFLLNRLNTAALKAIRSTGGKNLTRCVMLPTYAASTNNIALSNMEVSADPYTIIAVHAYNPNKFCTTAEDAYTASIEKSIRQMFGQLNDFKQAHGDVAMILGEFGCYPKTNHSDLIAWGNEYMSNVKALGIPCFVWDCGNADTYKLLDRNSCTWTDTEYLNTLFLAKDKKLR